MALSVAANVVQFVDFGVRTVSTFWRFVQSGTDAKSGIPDVQSTTRDLQELLKNLQSSTANASDIPENERSLYRLVDECQNVASDLLKLLNKISLPDKSRKRDTLKAACRMVFREEEIKSMHARLEGFRSQLTFHLLASLRYVL